VPYWFKNDVQDKKTPRLPNRVTRDQAEVKSNNLSTLTPRPTLEACAAKTEHVNVS